MLAWLRKRRARARAEAAEAALVEQTREQPDGTAITDLAETVRFIDDLAYELKARGLPRPHGRHLAIAIPIR